MKRSDLPTAAPGIYLVCITGPEPTADDRVVEGPHPSNDQERARGLAMQWHLRSGSQIQLVMVTDLPEPIAVGRRGAELRSEPEPRPGTPEFDALIANANAIIGGAPPGGPSTPVGPGVIVGPSIIRGGPDDD